MSGSDVAVDVNEHQAEQQPVMQEKVLTQDDVDRAVAARLARERQKTQSSGMGGMQAQPMFDEEALLVKATERMQQQMDEQKAAYEYEQQKAQAKQIADSYQDKMQLGKELYEDFDDVTSDFNPSAYWQVTAMATQHDNLPDIVYELSKNPRKLVDLHVLALTNPALAKKEMLKLSQSIKQNEQAVATNAKSPTPLTKLKASAQAGQDTGKRTIRDMRKDPKFKV